MPRVKPVNDYIDKILEDGRVLPLETNELSESEAEGAGIPEVMFLSSRNRIQDSWLYTEELLEQDKFSFDDSQSISLILIACLNKSYYFQFYAYSYNELVIEWLGNSSYHIFKY